MGILERWIKNSSPLVKVTMGIAVISGAVVSYKMYYAPYVKRRRLLQAEHFAEALLEQEERIKEYEKP